LFESKASGKPSPTSVRTARAFAMSPARSTSRAVLSASKRIFTCAGPSSSHFSTTRHTSSTLRWPLPPIDA
jgi:hypothetical protein